MAWQSIVQILTAGGVGALGVSLVQAIPQLRKSGAEKDGLQAGADKTRAELELEVLEAGREQVAFLRAEITAMRAEFTSMREEREEFKRSLTEAKRENAELTRELSAARVELSRLRGVVAALSSDVDATRSELEGRDHVERGEGN
jgi:chromosome segregation ATPase